MFSSITKLFKPKEQPVVVAKDWRPGMWVIFNTQPHILYKLGTPCEIHGVDKTTGETTEILWATFDQLRQATYDEIPAIRRNISKEAAKDLGYGS